MPLEVVDITGHEEVVEGRHRFSGVNYRGLAWDLSHLDAFAFRVELERGLVVDVVTLFSSHCFTMSVRRDGRPEDQIPADEMFDDGRERRVLCPNRYELSQKLLRQIMRELPDRRIQIAATDRQNFVTLEERHQDGTLLFRYAVFFDVVKDSRRRKRLLLHVQSAYPLETLTRRQRDAGKVRLLTLLNAAYHGRKIRG